MCSRGVLSFSWTQRELSELTEIDLSPHGMEMDRFFRCALLVFFGKGWNFWGTEVV